MREAVRMLSSPLWGLLDGPVLVGDCVESMRLLPTASVDAVVCDPPYGIGFMGKEWDGPAIMAAAARDAEARKSLGPDSVSRPGRAQPRSSSAFGSAAHYAGPVSGGRAFQVWCEAWAREALRVLKPGGHLLAFGGTRTYHRLAAGIEDAGFEVRDCIAYMYGSGFPKSLDVSKAIDKAAGAEREVIGQRTDGRYAHGFSEQAKKALGGVVAAENESGFSGDMGVITAPATPEAATWDGWGTALKPAFEPIIVARKPLARTVAGNVLEHGTGALNIDGCRIDFRGEADEQESKGKNRHGDFGTEHGGNMVYGDYSRDELRDNYDATGRWPANVVLDPEAAGVLDAQTGVSKSSGGAGAASGLLDGAVYGDFSGENKGASAGGFGDVGGASRFFYCAKASRAERNAGLDEFEKKPILWSSGDQSPGTFQSEGTERAQRNAHPTVKPISLMRWLVRLVTPPGGIVLDPFAGSGTTGCAAALEGLGFIGVERDEDYARIAQARIAWWAEQPADLELDEVLAGQRARAAVASTGQMGLL